MQNQFENLIKTDLHSYLRSLNMLEERLPDAPDIEEKWDATAMAYIPDGIREFNDYPTVALGWMMYTGMAVAHLWDENWEEHGKQAELYTTLRDKRGFDCMDECIREEILGLDGEAYDHMEKVVGECAARTLANLRRQQFEPGTREAFRAFVACLHQMYLMGAAAELLRLGYHMTKM